jgi:hypothetical protein
VPSSSPHLKTATHKLYSTTNYTVVVEQEAGVLHIFKRFPKNTDHYSPVTLNLRKWFVLRGPVKGPSFINFFHADSLSLIADGKNFQIDLNGIYKGKLLGGAAVVTHESDWFEVLMRYKIIMYFLYSP